MSRGERRDRNGDFFSTNNSARVLCDDGMLRLCQIKGKKIKSLAGSYNSLAVGDIVDVLPTEADKAWSRDWPNERNTFGRYNEKGKAEQAIAANIDMVFCVASPRLLPRPRFIDRLAVMAEWAQVPFIIVLNKIDLGVPEEVESRLVNYAGLGYKVVRASAKTGEGIDLVRGPPRRLRWRVCGPYRGWASPVS